MDQKMQFTRENYEAVKKYLRLAPEHTLHCDQSEFGVQHVTKAVKVITERNVPVVAMVLGAAVWSLIVADAAWLDVVCPVFDYGSLLEGNLGTILGVSALTDCYYSPEQQFMQRGEILFIGENNNVKIFSRLQVRLND